MFIQINNQRIPANSIKRYKDAGQSVSNGKWRISIKIVNMWEEFYFDTEEEKNRILNNLDTAVKVIVL